MSRGVVLKREGRCMRGHPVNEENTHHNAKHNVTVCRPCRNERRRFRYANDAEYREREKAKSRAAAARRVL